MKNIYPRVAAVIASVVMLASCGGNAAPGEDAVFAEGIAPVILGSKIADLPAQAEGLYDSFEIVNFTDDEFEYEADRTYAQFNRNGKTVMEADLDLNDLQTINTLTIFDPALTYKGFGVGASAADLLKSGFKFYATGDIESCWFGAWFGTDSVRFEFDTDTETSGFTTSGFSKIYAIDFDSISELDFGASDFKTGTKITKITLVM